MKLAKILLATTLTLTAFSTFAATAKDKDQTDKEQATQIESEKVIVSTQEQPTTQDQPLVENSAAGQPTTAQPTTESAATEGSPLATPETTQPVQ